MGRLGRRSVCVVYVPPLVCPNLAIVYTILKVCSPWIQDRRYRLGKISEPKCYAADQAQVCKRTAGRGRGILID